MSSFTPFPWPPESLHQGCNEVWSRVLLEEAKLNISPSRSKELNSRGGVRVTALNIKAAFHPVWHQWAPAKPNSMTIRGKTLHWLESGLLLQEHHHHVPHSGHPRQENHPSSILPCVKAPPHLINILKQLFYFSPQLRPDLLSISSIFVFILDLQLPQYFAFVPVLWSCLEEIDPQHKTYCIICPNVLAKKTFQEQVGNCLGSSGRCQLWFSVSALITEWEECGSECHPTDYST